MKNYKNLSNGRQTLSEQSESKGFSAVELLITLFIAAAFMISGYQLYAVVIKDGGEARMNARAANVATDYLQRYKSSATIPCTVQTPLTNAIPNPAIPNLSNTTVSVAISCPYSSSTSVSKVIVTFKYGTPQQTITNSTFVSTVTAPITPISAIGLISGTTTVGQTLTAGALTPLLATANYQWQSATTVGGTYASISGAISSTYTLQSTDADKFIKVVATGSGSYSGTQTSSATTIITPLIVASGLVLNLDAGNTASYPSPFTSLTWTDLSGLGNNGTLVNGVGYSSANGEALTFDGSDDYVNVPYSSVFNVGSTYSVSAWINISGAQENRPIIEWGGYTTNGFLMRTNEGGTNVLTVYNGNASSMWTYAFSPNVWYNVLISQSATNSRTAYVNNVSLGSNTNASNPVSSSGNFYIGKITSGGVTNGNWKGLINNVNIYNRALTPAEITQNFNALRGRYGL